MSIKKTVRFGTKYTIGFADEFLPYIKQGKTLQTYRLGLKYNYLKSGDNVELFKGKDNEIFSEAKIVSVKKTTFSELPLTRPGFKSFKDKNEQRKALSNLYKNVLGRDIVDSDIFIVLEIKITKILN